MERRRKVVGKLDEARLPEEMKANFKKAIITEMMSSEDETFDTDAKSCFNVKPLPFPYTKI